MMLPSLFISHGSPALMITQNRTTRFLENLPSMFDKPKYILVISAHWVTKNLKILYEENPSLIYDFYGFPKEMYSLKYEAVSSKIKANEIITLLTSNNISIEKDDFRGGFDHGVWSPLKFMYPKADIPVIQISLPMNYNSQELHKLGEVLSSLREDTLIIGSGSVTHNLRDLNWDENNSSAKPYVKEFKNWVSQKVISGESESLINYKQEAPYVTQNHPTLDHFLPLYVCLGSSKTKKGKSLNDIYMHGNLSMDTFMFKE